MWWGISAGCHCSGAITAVWVPHGHNISCQRQTNLAQKKTFGCYHGHWHKVMGKQNTFSCRPTLGLGWWDQCQLWAATPRGRGSLNVASLRSPGFLLTPETIWFSLLLPLRWIQASQEQQALSLVDCLWQVEQGKAFSWNKLYILSLERCHRRESFIGFFPLNKSHF